jgi:hypothetical protein
MPVAEVVAKPVQEALVVQEAAVPVVAAAILGVYPENHLLVEVPEDLGLQVQKEWVHKAVQEL